MWGMLNQRCTIKRYQTVKDAYNTPIDDDWVEVGQYPCRLSRKTIKAVQGSPDNRTEEVLMLYLPTATNIQPGDLAEVVGAGKYKASTPYRPGGPYAECQVDWEGPI